MDAILGALAAGVLVALASPGEHGEALRHKLEAIGFGLFVPIFFVTTGLRYDLQALLASSSALMQVPLFLALFLLVRGLPALLVRRDLDGPTRVALGLVSATQLPLVVAIVDIGQRSGQLRPETGASLVGAGMASVLLFPIAALALRRRYARPAAIPIVVDARMEPVASGEQPDQPETAKGLASATSEVTP
jgi:Kef-type K+ transport system membrane component KefB